MKTKILIIVFTVAVITSFSFISINKETLVKKEPAGYNNHQTEPVSGFAMEDKDQF